MGRWSRPDGRDDGAGAGLRRANLVVSYRIEFSPQIEDAPAHTRTRVAHIAGSYARLIDARIKRAPRLQARRSR
jgi:hypothetical protein